MKNLIDYIAYPIGFVLICFYILIGVVFDTCIKLIAAVISILVVIICILITPFFKNPIRLKSLKKLYHYGGKWEFCGDNYYITDKLLNKYLL